jgi:radical SAM protein with 4Fe4S-binding SPASM domain
MSAETFRAILDRLAGYTDYLYLHVKGEPLLHPLLSEFLDICSEKGFQVNITTNGTLIRETGNMLLSKPSVRQVNFSLQSFDGNLRSLSRSEYIGNILSFAKEAMEKTQMFVSLRLWNLHEDKSEKRQNDEILTIIEEAFELTDPIGEDGKTGRGIKIADRLYVNQASEFVWPDIKEKEDCGDAFCYGLRNQAAILVDGTVVPCCLDGEGVINLGNILTTPFSEIIESDRARNIVDGFTRKEAVEELCRKCGYRTRF